MGLLRCAQTVVAHDVAREAGALAGPERDLGLLAEARGGGDPGREHRQPHVNRESAVPASPVPQSAQDAVPAAASGR